MNEILKKKRIINLQSLRQSGVDKLYRTQKYTELGFITGKALSSRGKDRFYNM